MSTALGTFSSPILSARPLPNQNRSFAASFGLQESPPPPTPPPHSARINILWSKLYGPCRPTLTHTHVRHNQSIPARSH